MRSLPACPAWMGTKRATEACERAAGLVVSHLYRYKVRAQGFADHILMSRYPNLDLATARSTLFSERLNHIQTELAKSQAQVKHGVGIDPTLLACVPPLRARCATCPLASPSTLRPRSLPNSAGQIQRN